MTTHKTGRDFLVNFQTRAEADKRYIEGYFAVFDSTYPLWDKYYERIDEHAFDKTIGEHDVICLWNHDSNYPLARQSNKTLTLSVDGNGLFGRAELNENDRFAMDVYERIRRGDVSQCSFGFDIREEKRNELKDGGVEFVLEDIELFEISPCTFPAYEETSVQARTDQNNRLLETKKKIIQERLIELVKKIKETEGN